MKAIERVDVNLHYFEQLIPFLLLVIFVTASLLIWIATLLERITMEIIILTAGVPVAVAGAFTSINIALKGKLGFLSNLEIFLPLLWFPVIIIYYHIFRKLADRLAESLLLHDLKAIGFIEDNPVAKATWMSEKEWGSTVTWTEKKGESPTRYRGFPRWFAWLAYASFYQLYNDRKSLPHLEGGTINLHSWDSPKIRFQAHRLIKEAGLAFREEKPEKRSALTPYLIISKDKDKILYAAENQFSLERLRMCEKLDLAEIKSFEGLPDEWVLKLI